MSLIGITAKFFHVFKNIFTQQFQIKLQTEKSLELQLYTRFTTEPDAMPNVVRDAWREIWNMSDKNPGGKRRYIADFEIYDERASDHQNIVLDIYVGIEK